MNTDVQSNLRTVLERIQDAERRAGRPSGSVKLLAVTKSVEAEGILAAVEAGLRMFGENRVQEAERKREKMPDGIEYHLIGHLQSNKARKAVELFDCVESVDSLELARRLGNEAARRSRNLPILLEVNIGNESSKSGFDVADLEREFAEMRCVPSLLVQGLMCIPPASEREEARRYFSNLRTLGDRLYGAEPFELSMGMSHDFEDAILEGSTLVRIGTAIFGERAGCP